MDAERWRRVNDLFHAALERDPGGRDDFLAEACAGDEALRAEVSSLLRLRSGPGVVDRPAVEADPGLLDAAGDPLIGRRLGPYEVTALLGRGGMGVVYLGHDTRLRRPVAIKALSPAFTHDDRMRARLRREAMAAAALSHPGVATVFALEEFEAQLYLVQEFVPGRTLRAEMKERGGRMAVAEVVGVALDVARALAAAHAHGVLHRDLKPENVLRTPDGGIKVVDFGLARFEPGAGGGDAETLTRPGVMLGTPAYMAPEALRGDPVDARADQFSFGVLLYELLTGEHPFGGAGDVGTVARILEAEPRGPAGPERPPALVHVVTTCLAKAPRDRYRTTAALVSALETVRDAVATEAGAAGADAAAAPAGRPGNLSGPDQPALVRAASASVPAGRLADPHLLSRGAPDPGAAAASAPPGRPGTGGLTPAPGLPRPPAPASGGLTPAPASASGPPRSPAPASGGPSEFTPGGPSPGASLPSRPPTGAGEDGVADPRWWWQFHQAAVSGAYALMLYPLWRAREWLPAPWGLAAFLTAAVVVGAAVNLRLHLWFTARVYPAQLAARRRASAVWRRLLDSAFAVLLLSVAAAVAPGRPRWAAFFIVVAISSALSARVMEPATTRAAFPDD